jgi:archaellum component FlaC
LEQKDYERIAALETQLETLTKSMERIETKLDLLTSSFITRNEADIRFQNLKEEIEELKQNKRANSALMVSVISVAVTFIFGLINILKG